MNSYVFKFDFAFSYAGENSKEVKEISDRLEELGFNVFYAKDHENFLVGIEGKEFLKKLYIEAKQSVVFISKHYRKKIWSKFEWEFILKNNLVNRVIPIYIDDSKIEGMPSNIFYKKFTGSNYSEIVDTCIQKLLLFEKDSGISRPSDYETMLKKIRDDSKGALALAYQLIKDKRTRTPLEDCEPPEGDLQPCYEISNLEWNDFSKVKRLSIKILVPSNLSKDELVYNLKHCSVIHFNTYKPGAIMVFAYEKEGEEINVSGPYTAGRLIFAPFGKWDKALDGFAYNIAVSEFEYSVELNPSYFK